jgi:hypothetical protein
MTCPISAASDTEARWSEISRERADTQRKLVTRIPGNVECS